MPKCITPSSLQFPVESGAAGANRASTFTFPAYIPGDGVEYTPSPRVPEVAQISKPWAQPDGKFARAFRTPYGVVEQWQLHQIREEKDMALARVGYLEFVIMKLEKQLMELGWKVPKPDFEPNRVPKPYLKRVRNRRTQTDAPDMTSTSDSSSSIFPEPDPFPQGDKAPSTMATQTDQERMKAGITSTSDRPTQTDGLTPIFLIPPLDKAPRTVETQTDQEMMKTGVASTSNSLTQTDDPVFIPPEHKDTQTGGEWQTPVETQTEGPTPSSDSPTQTDDPVLIPPEDKDTQTGAAWQIPVETQTEDKPMKSCRTQTAGTAFTSDSPTQTDDLVPPENKDTQTGGDWQTTTETQTDTKMKSRKTQTPPPPPPEPFIYYGTPAFPLGYP
eukprot:CAMPEP_0202382866 /NCGR_PEP_ID=MMETSP1127-20130417/45819_1 /ASSEMBLY_ACC=CAM_ASM_000462 /TAXON_ID=3047 /ORGANISM="Dunaliella tertiolecta, Strain CCMP1320" /LENGTH=386 /DNA_ID=CAMNT_0048982189 /DNA_START=149 /DNA_END=1306 /DNA_ORIENTATION=-